MMFRVADKEKMVLNENRKLENGFEYSPSSLSCFDSHNGFYDDDDNSSSGLKTHCLNELWFDQSRFVNQHLIDDESRLCQSLCRMSFQDEPPPRNYTMRGFNQGFGFESGSFDGSNNGAFGYEGLQQSFLQRVPTSFSDMKPALLDFGRRNGCGDKRDSMESNFGPNLNQFRDYCSDSSWCYSKCHSRKEPEGSVHGNGNGIFVGLQECGVSNRRAVDPYGPLEPMFPNLDVNANGMFYSGVMKQRATNSNIGIPQSRVGDTEGFNSDHSFIIPEKVLNGFVAPKQSSNVNVYNLDNHNNPLPLPSISFLAGVHGYVYIMAKDQYGCRFLQRVCNEGTSEDVQLIFNEIIDHVVELMMEPFGNYLVQKLLEVCNEDQISQVVLMVTKEPGQLVKVSFNTYGTRVVQKLIETLRTRQQIVFVKLAIQPGFLHLIKDLNGNHVIQRCLQCFKHEDNKFIFDAAAKFCVDMATHQHGCCVLQRCIGYSTGEQRDKLITEVALHGLQLAQDPYGNYVVQYIIDLKLPSAVAKLHAQFKGRYVQLSMQKFSSHVVEKWLKDLAEGRSRIVHELLAVSNFEHLLQDPYANYVIQSALKVTKGPLHDVLVEAVRSHRVLRTNPYSKRIFSRNLLKK